MDQVRHNGDSYACTYAQGGGDMTKLMTVVFHVLFHNEELYTCLKIEAARRHKPASDIVGEAIQEWSEKQGDMELPPIIDAARAEWQERGGRPWNEVGTESG